MNWPEISIEDFPPRRDDEPTSLRQDIIDELSDHFACALNRELLKNPDEQTAKQRVLNQFGDPIKIARQLWLDAMKEKIMSQRIMTGVSVVAAVCCIAVVGIAWSMMQQSERINLLVLERLTQNPPVQESIGTEGMNLISFQLIQDSGKKQSAVGFTGQLMKTGSQSDSFELESVSDQGGKLDFGKLPWGKYRLKLTAPWGESAEFPHLTVVPGRNYSKTLVCPSEAPARATVKFQVNWTDQFKSEDWCLICDFRDINTGMNPSFPTASYSFRSMREVNDVPWILNHRQEKQKTEGVYLIDAQNRVTACPLNEYGYLENIDSETLQVQPALSLAEGRYILPVLYLVSRKDLSKLSTLSSRLDYQVFNWERSGKFSYSPDSHPSRFEFYNYFQYGPGSRHPQTMSSIFLVPFNEKRELTNKMNIIEVLAYRELVEGTREMNHLDGVQIPELLVFSASTDEPNLWKIKLPEK
ncbi:hypothetical protein [uncultured Gimesia sp.]|uniref:hypothetical protein n=1 Tax=uncultured Gimesia sp. TaxID=1678688 RepID=UPI000EC0E5AB|nr:hypothetical protein [Planctomycetaceae bacterium]